MTGGGEARRRFAAGGETEEGARGAEERSDRRTVREFRKVANTILSRSVVMEEDFPSNHTSRKLPILDMQVWVQLQSNVIYHEHYTKPMSSQAVVMANSAFPPNMKKNIVLEEGSRRLRNCSPSLPWEAKVKYCDGRSWTQGRLLNHDHRQGPGQV